MKLRKIDLNWIIVCLCVIVVFFFLLFFLLGCKKKYKLELIFVIVFIGVLVDLMIVFYDKLLEYCFFIGDMKD